MNNFYKLCGIKSNLFSIFYNNCHLIDDTFVGKIYKAYDGSVYLGKELNFLSFSSDILHKDFFMKNLNKTIVFSVEKDFVSLPIIKEVIYNVTDKEWYI